MTTIDGKKTLLVYLDEAGDTNFGDSGTKHFLHTALVLAEEGFPLHRALLECRYEIIADNGRFSNSHENNDYLHATEDSLETRDKVFPVLKENAGNAHVYTLVADKSTFPEEARSQAALFEHAASALLRTVIEGEGVREGYDRICIMLDNIPFQSKQFSELFSTHYAPERARSPEANRDQGRDQEGGCGGPVRQRRHVRGNAHGLEERPLPAGGRLLLVGDVPKMGVGRCLAGGQTRRQRRRDSLRFRRMRKGDPLGYPCGRATEHLSPRRNVYS